MGLLDDIWTGVVEVARGTPAERLAEILGGHWIDAQRLGKTLEDFEAKGALDDPAAMRVLCEAVDLAAVWQVLERRTTALVMPALLELLARDELKRPWAKAHAEPLLDRVSLRADPAALPEGVRGLALERRRRQGHELPAAPWSSPWVSAKKKPRKGAVAVTLAAYPERFVLSEPIAPVPEDPERDRQYLARPGVQGKRALMALNQLSDVALLREWQTLAPDKVWVWGGDLEVLVPRVGLPGLEVSLALVKAFPSGLGGLKELESARVAPLMAPHLSGRPALRTLAREWFLRFPEAGAVGLAPELVGGERKAQQAAQEAFRWLRRQQPGAVAAALARYPKEAQDAVEAALAEGVAMPGRKPTLPEWAEPKVLPCPVTVDGRASLQKEALFELLQVLAVTPLEGAGWLEAIRQAFTPESLQQLSRALFYAWLGSGASPKDRWALYASAHFPSAGLAAELAERAAELAPQGLSARAQEMVEVLAAMQTREGLEKVHQLAKRVRSKAFRARAVLVFASAAEKMGLTEDELAERLVDDFGLSPEGWLPVTPRVRLVVKKLKPQLVSEDGKPVKTWPTAADPEADAELKELKRKAGGLLKEGAARLERRMTLGRPMSFEHFTETYLMNGLLRGLIQGVVFAVLEGGRPALTFVVTEMGPVDVEGRPVPPQEGRAIAVAHPLELDEETRAAWRAKKLEPPFAQLDRKLRPVMDVRALETALHALEGRPVPVAAVLRLERFGWIRGPEVGHGCFVSFARELGPLGRVELEFYPGVYLGDPMGSGDQTVNVFRVALAPQTPVPLLSELEREVREALTTPVQARGS